MFKKSLVILLLSLILSFVLTSCGSSNSIDDNNFVANKESNNDVTVNEINFESETEESIKLEELSKNNPALKRGNVLTVGINSFEGQFNPIFANSTYDLNVCDAVFNGLIKINEYGENIPDLATWEISEDKLTYIFHITEGVTFSNGDELTATDVEFTYYAIANPGYDGPRKSVLSDILGVAMYSDGESDFIDGIKVIDSYTISFTLEENNVSKISDFSCGILNHNYYAYETIEELKELNNAPMGTGIFTFSKFEAGKYIEFITNPTHFLGVAKIDGMIYKVVPDVALANAINVGEIDVAEVSSNLENYNTIIESGIANVQEYLGNSYRYIGFNLRLDKFQDKRVRQALFYGLNLKEFIDAQWEGFASSCLSPISPLSWAYPEESTLIDYSFNPKKAAELLAEAGWFDTDGDGILDKDGEKFTIVWTSYNEVKWPLNLIEVAKKNWKVLGIELEENLMEFPAVLELVFDKQEFEMYNMAWSLVADPDPSEIFGEKADVLGGYNSVGFHNERASEIFNLANKEYDQVKKAALYQEWAQIANEELPYLFVSIGIYIQGVNKRVNNLKLDTFNSLINQVLDIELDYVN